MLCNSLHHQRQYVADMASDQYKLLAWAINKDGDEKLSPYSLGENDDDDMSGDKEAEVVFYPYTKALGIQPHPEMLVGNKEEWAQEFISYCQGLVEEYLEN